MRTSPLFLSLATLLVLVQVGESVLWIANNETVYGYSISRRNFDDARKECADAQATLVSIHDSELNAWLVQNPMSYQMHNNSLWIGMRQFHGMKYSYPLQATWLDKTPVDFISFAPMEPKRVKGSDACMYMKALSAGVGLWGADSCFNLRHFVCQRPLTP